MSPQNPTRVAIDRAKALVTLKRYPQAKEVLARALASDPDHAEALAELARTHHFLGENVEALPLVDRALARAAEAWMFRVRAMILNELFRMDEAIAAVEAAIKLEPRQGGHHAALARLLRRDRRAEAALVAAKRGVECNPGSAYCLAQLGISAFEAGDLELAASTTRRVLEIDPDDASHHIQLANVLAKAGRDGEVIAVLRNALALHPTDLWLLGMLAIKLERAGETDEAARVDQGAARVAARNAGAWAELGSVAESEGDRARGIAYFGRANALDPTDPDAAFWLASLLDDAHRALEIVERALATQPTHQQLVQCKLELLKRLDRYDEAIATATAYYERTGEVIQLISALAIAGRLDELARYEPILDQLPDGHDKFEEHGNIALARGDWARAEAKFREVLADGSTCCCSWAGLGVALYELGRREEAGACERAVTEHNWSCRCVMATSLRCRLG